MESDVYQKLAHHLDQLPGGFPPTPDGLELRILKKLFTPEHAAMALHLTLIPETAAVVARRAGMPQEETGLILAEMSRRGLIGDQPARTTSDGTIRPPRYAAAQFVVGIWEFQVNRLDEDLVRLVDAYLPYLLDVEAWKKAPQLRTIPVGESIKAPSDVMTYESAGQLILAKDRYAVQPCLCRQEKELVGEGCGKPLDVCLSMDGAADFAVRHQNGRMITREEALGVLKTADRAGLVLQPGNIQDPNFICCCCGDCCGVLRTVKLHPHPAEILSSAFYAVCDQELCGACGECLYRCQMEAIDVDAGYAVIALDRCIGCGLCVTTCPNEALSLVRKPEKDAPDVPQNNIELYLRLSRARGVLPPREIARMLVKSGVDRVRAR